MMMNDKTSEVLETSEVWTYHSSKSVWLTRRSNPDKTADILAYPPKIINPKKRNLFAKNPFAQKFVKIRLRFTRKVSLIVTYFTMTIFLVA